MIRVHAAPTPDAGGQDGDPAPVNAVDARNLVRRFGGEDALSGVTFAASSGERIALVGRNGAGKTTLLRVLASVLPPDSGAATVAGFDVFSQSLEVRAAVGYLPEGAPLDPEMDVASYLAFRGRLRGMPRRRLRRRLHEVSEFCDLARLLRRRIGALSAGQRRAVGLADSILHEPAVLLLDDPLSALDPAQAESFRAMLSSPDVSEGRLVVFATHDETLVRAAATRILFLERGRLLADVPSLPPGTGLKDAFAAWSRAASGTEGGTAR